MTIGDDLRTMLGWIPVRDRAGIARSTLADQSPNAEGQTLTRQGFAPPPALSLPPAMGRPPTPDVDTTGSIGGTDPAPVPRERVVASSPAAAPSPAVATKASDVVMAALEQQQRQARMMQLIGHIGTMANAFNRNPQSQAATKASFAGMIGAGAGGGIDVKDITTLYDLREKEKAAAQTEADRRTTVDQLQRMFGLSKEDAEARVATGNAAKLLDPATIAKRAEDQRAGSIEMMLDKPEVIQEIMKRTGMPEFQVRAEIKNREILKKIDLKELSAIEENRSQTAARRQTTEVEAGEIMSYEDAKNNRGRFMEKYDLSPTAADQKLINRKAFDKFVSDHAGVTGTQQNYQYDRAKAREAGPTALAAFDAKYPDLPTYDRSKVHSTVEGLSEAGAKKEVERKIKEYEKLEPAADEAEKHIMVGNRISQDLHDDKLIAGSKISPYTLAGRKMSAQLLGYKDTAAENTDVFFAERKRNALEMRGNTMPGALSNDDREFLTEVAGSQKHNPEVLKRMLIIQEKIKRAELEQHNARVVADRKLPGTETVGRLREQPEHNRFLSAALASEQGQQAIAKLLEEPDNRQGRIIFDESFGAGSARKFLTRAGKWKDDYYVR